MRVGTGTGIFRVRAGGGTGFFRVRVGTGTGFFRVRVGTGTEIYRVRAGRSTGTGIFRFIAYSSRIGICRVRMGYRTAIWKTG